MDKKDRLESKQAMVSHAMTLTGFNHSKWRTKPVEDRKQLGQGQR